MTDNVLESDPITNQRELHGTVPNVMVALDELCKANISTSSDITSATTEIQRANDPLAALQQITRNAIMHRSDEASNAPVRVTWFRDRIEIQNPGGPYGQVTRTNFGQAGITDYRNPNLANAVKELGFVQRFGVGITTANRILRENGNPEVTFDV